MLGGVISLGPPSGVETLAHPYKKIKKDKKNLLFI
jgi:hypothetical protein